MNQHVHIIGIGGIGTSALAQWYLATGHIVSGSDAAASELTDSLKQKGITIYIGHNAKNVGNAELVIITAAIAVDNPELLAAQKNKIKILLYSQALGEISAKYKTIAVSGAHGKSTTTAMLAKILIDAGLDPTVIVGTKMNDLNGNNFRFGKGEHLVVEADDFNRHFLELNQYVSVVTNIDAEHLDIYNNLDGVKQAFAKYISNTNLDGFVVANGQDQNTLDVVGALPERKSELVIYNQNRLAHHSIDYPGKHNQSNAEAAAAVARHLGIANSVIEQSLKNFGGVWRRLEELREGLYTDYAHHPNEIRATLTALKQANPDKQLICVYQPHQRKRLAELFDDFVTAFDAADQTYLLPVYVVRGRDDATGVDSDDLVAKISKPQVQFAASFEAAYSLIELQLNTANIVVFMGAGNIDSLLRQKLQLA